MNYIKLINSFWQCNKEHSFGSSTAYIYFYLVHTCNSLGWKNPFKHSDRHIAIYLGMSVNTVRNGKNKLKQRGLIDFKAGNPKGGRSLESLTEYNLNLSNIDKYPVTLSDMNSDTLTDKYPDNNNKQNKTKHIYDDNSKFSKLLKSDAYSFWLETVSVQQKKSPGEILKKLDDFNVFLTTIQKEHTAQSEYVSHFINWISKNKNTKNAAVQKPAFSINR